MQLVNIMVDSLPELRAEAQTRGITGIVASDVDKKVSNAYEALQASMHPGAKPGHTFVLVTKTGQIIWRWDWMGHGKPMYMDTSELYDYVSEWIQKTQQPGAKFSKN